MAVSKTEKQQHELGEEIQDSLNLITEQLDKQDAGEIDRWQQMLSDYAGTLEHQSMVYERAVGRVDAKPVVQHTFWLANAIQTMLTQMEVVQYHAKTVTDLVDRKLNLDD